MAQTNEIFRQKSLNRISSPEELDGYLKVVNPGIWIVLGTIIVLLMGFIVVCTVGTVEDKDNVVAFVSNNEVTVYLNDQQTDKLTEDSVLRIEGNEQSITKSEGVPMCIDDKFDEYKIYYVKAQKGDWVTEYKGSCNNLKDGMYDATVLYESFKPVNLLFETK